MKNFLRVGSIALQNTAFQGEKTEVPLVGLFKFGYIVGRTPALAQGNELDN